MLEEHIKERLKTKDILLMTHLVAGYPSFDDNRKMLDAMQAADVDIVEIQFPFSEPIADGPLFVKANQDSLSQGTRIQACFDFLEEAAQKYTFPLLMMGYYNTIYKLGEETYCQTLAAKGAKGFIAADILPEQATNLYAHAEKNSLDPILLITPNTTLERKREIAESAKGFIYCVARKGVTGQDTEFGTSIENYLKEVRSVTNLPLALGFGVKSQKDLDFLKGKADIAVIGSAGLAAYHESGAAGLEKLLSFA